MKPWNLCLAALAVFAPFGSSIYGKSSNSFEINERDFLAVQEFLSHVSSDKLLNEENEFLSRFNISGDVRFEFKNLEETMKFTLLNGNNDPILTRVINILGNNPERDAFGLGPLAGTNEFDAEFNLYLDYTAEKTWGHVQLEMDNFTGPSVRTTVVSIDPANPPATLEETFDIGGECNQLCLRSAYFGINLAKDDNHRFDMEIGRWDMLSIFESRVQFQHRYDGALFTYGGSFQEVGDVYLKFGSFVIDSVASNWGYAVEAGWMDVMSLGIDLRYSFVDYQKSNDRLGNGLITIIPGTLNNPDTTVISPCVAEWTAQISQFSADYSLDEEWLSVPTKFYSAILVNHAARKELTPPKAGKENIAWYMGVTVGRVEREGDWSFDMNYQSVGALSMPGFSVSGIGTGNSLGVCYQGGSETAPQLGNTNYCGFLLEGAYALTDNILLTAEFEYSKELDKEANSSGTAATAIKFPATIGFLILRPPIGGLVTGVNPGASSGITIPLQRKFMKYEAEIIYTF